MMVKDYEIDLNDTPSEGSRKRRFQNACDICKQKKVRCDSMSMPNNICSNCIAFGSECTHVAANRRKKIKRKGSNLSDDTPTVSMSMQVARITAAPGLYILPQDVNEVRRLVIDLAIYARDLEDQVSNASKAASTSSTSSPRPVKRSSTSPALGTRDDTTDVDFDSVNYLTKKLLALSSGEPDYSGIGAFSPVKLLQNTWDAKQRYYGTRHRLDDALEAVERSHCWTTLPWLKGSRVPPTPLEFPEKELILHLCHLYFRHVSPFYPLLHRPTFMRNVHEEVYLSDSKFGCVLLSVCACASKYSDDPQVLADGFHQLGWRWYVQLQPAHKCVFETSSIEELQTFCNCLLYLQWFSPAIMWFVLGNAIRIAHEAGVHNRQWYSRCNKSALEKELWKRAFWFLVMHDIMQSYLLGRPRGMTPDDYDLDLPAECDDESWESSNPEEGFQQPAGKASTMTFWIWFLKLQSILGYAQRTIHAARRPEILEDCDDNWHKMAVIRINILLDNWKKCLPDYLRRNRDIDDPVLEQQSATLSLVYNWVQMEIHRPFLALLGKPLSPSESSSLTACVKAARACIHIASESVRKAGLVQVPLLPIILFNASAILLQDLWGGKMPSPKFLEDTIQFQEVGQCIDMLGTCEERWQLAGRVRDVLIALTKSGIKGDGGFPSESESSENEYDYSTTRCMWGTDGTENFETSDVRHTGGAASAYLESWMTQAPFFAPDTNEVVSEPTGSTISTVSTPYETPENPEILNFSTESPQSMAYMAQFHSCLGQFTEEDFLRNQATPNIASQMTNLPPTWFQEATTRNRWREWDTSESIYHPYERERSADIVLNSSPYIYSGSRLPGL